jgi:uncharacterized membrane protein YkvA (DUF1232 family)
MEWIAYGLAAVFVLWALVVGGLMLAGRHAEARALARFVPDCVVLFKRLLADPAVPRRRKLALLALLGYLVMPIDLVPDFIPVVGQLDDAIVVVLALRYVLRSGGPALVERHWPGPPDSLDVITRLAFGSRA